MSEEVKAILDYLKDDRWDYYPSDGIPYKVFLCEERDILLDYITSLQNENERLKEELKSIKSNYKTQLEYDENLEKLNNANYLSFIDVNKKRLKAIGFIKEEAGYDEEIRSCCCDLLYSDCDKLIELLGGDEK